MTGSIGTVGDAYDNALAETLIGLYKAECIAEDSPFNPSGVVRGDDLHIASVGMLEDMTAAWVHWYNTERLMHRLGLRPPAEADAQWWAAHRPATGSKD